MFYFIKSHRFTSSFGSFFRGDNSFALHNKLYIVYCLPMPPDQTDHTASTRIKFHTEQRLPIHSKHRPCTINSISFRVFLFPQHFWRGVISNQFQYRYSYEFFNSSTRQSVSRCSFLPSANSMWTKSELDTYNALSLFNACLHTELIILPCNSVCV